MTERFDLYWMPEPNTGCWLWIGGIRNKGGHGSFDVDGTQVYAHRHSYERVHGLIPEGMVIDHRCRVRCCVNPDHLRVVTKRQNAVENSNSPSAKAARATECPQGHPYSGANLLVYAGVRYCRACARARRWGHRRTGQ